MNIKLKLVKLKRNILCKMPPKVAHSIDYFLKHYGFMRWKTPLTYDEKIHWLIVNTYDENYGKYADKYEVRDYVKACGLEEILIPLLGVFDNVEQIDYDNLPDKFILKTTHASGQKFYAVCRDRIYFDEESVNAKLAEALKSDFSKRNCEYHYKSITPRIVCEKLLEQDNQDMLTDYKVICSYGRPLRILVCKDRNEGRDYYDTDWNYCDYVKSQYRSGIIEEKPKQLEEMLHAAAILSEPFPLARVDFYIVKERIYFGEITLSPSSGNHKNLNKTGQMELGKLIVLK